MARKRTCGATNAAAPKEPDVLNPADIALELARIAVHPIVAAPAEVPDLEPVLDVLRDRTGVDFTHYKPNTLYRRIVRRIVLHELGGIGEYVKLLHSLPTEADHLYQDILINVTSFFRNPEAFDALKTDVFPALTHDRSRHDPVRIWTLGCSTGEEAYSLAMAFAEFAESLGRSTPVQVFATDLNATSIDKARRGFYARASVADVGAERVRRFFVETDGGYRIAKPIRDACIFARHNVLDDPPFPRIDLVSCRNMLIYLGTELQRQVIPILHYALRPHGFLWLGTSETIGAYRDLFELRNTRYKVYAKKPAQGHTSIVTTPPPARTAPSVVVFEERLEPAAAHEGAQQEVAQLKQELAATREYLQSVIAQQEAANEKLQSANEEVQSANEELQSINEELETSKREVQSSNEALATMNDELQRCNGELAQTNHDLIKLLSSVQAAIVALADVDTLKRSPELLQQTELLTRAHEPIIMWELDGHISYWNKAAEECYGFTAKHATGRRVHELLLSSPAYENFRSELVEKAHWTGEIVHTRRDGRKIIVESRMVVVTDTAGRKLVVEANRPITRRARCT